jgi:tetratricopeptide (TPR) repeat protein
MRGPAAVLALALAAAAAPNPLHGDLPFAATLESGRAEAQWRGKPLLVFYSLKGDDASLRVAGTAFKDAAVVARASAFVPVLVDADADERFGLERGVKTVPTILLLDPRGREAGRAAGNAGPAEVLQALDEALKRIGSLTPPKEARDLAKAAAALDQALAKGEWKAVLKSARSIEKIDHAGPELDAARKAVAAATEEAGRRLAAAKKLVKDGKRDEARAEFRRIVRDFPGLDAAVEAKNLVKEMDGPDGGDDDGGGEGGGKKDPWRRGGGRAAGHGR